MKTESRKKSDFDLNKYRLRSFLDKLIDLNEVDIHEEPVRLTEVTRILESSSKAVLLKDTGPDHVELVGNVMGKRGRLAAAFDTTEEKLVDEFHSRLNSPQPIEEINSGEAPVHEVILEGEKADLTRLPFYLHHQFDGSAYISSGIDFSIDPETGRTNVGCRRLCLKNRRETSTNLTAPSDLKGIYQRSVKRGEKLHINFALGAHPIDYLAAVMRIPADEVKLIGTLRGEPVPMVKGITNDVRVPADAEVIIEGYLDERGYREPEGPYGEYMGFYGFTHINPAYHVTAITMRKDALHQTLLHGCGRVLQRAESANLYALVLEDRARTLLKASGIEPVNVCAKLSSGECQHLRVSIKKTGRGQARKTMVVLFGSLVTIKHIFVVDEDVDVFSDDEFEWALSSRFQADRDLVLFEKMQGFPMDPSLDGKPLGTKAGFDLTIPINQRDLFSWQVCDSPQINKSAQTTSLRTALESGPKFFVDLMGCLGSDDGREIALELDKMHKKGELTRLENGKYALKDRDKV